MSTTIGRLEAGRADTILDHSPEGSTAAMLSKQDEIIALLKDLADKLDNDAGVNDIDFAATLTDALAKLELRL